MALPKTFAEGQVLTAADLNQALQYLDTQQENTKAAALSDSGWKDPDVWGNGYIAYSNTLHKGLQYRVRNGVVQLRGAFRKSSNGAMDAAAIANLPAAVRPTSTIEGTNIFIQPDGNIFTTYRGSGAIHGNAWWFVG